MTRISGTIGGVSDSALAQRSLGFGTPLDPPAGFTYARSLLPFTSWSDAGGRVRRFRPPRPTPIRRSIMSILTAPIVVATA